MIDSQAITELTIGMGPAGELRYPSYPEGDGRWRFPGVGEFQCYDRYMLADLRRAAETAHRPEWGLSGPHDAGNYNSRPWETAFFVSQGGSWDTEYGRFFLGWYSDALLRHAERLLSVSYSVLNHGQLPRRCVQVKQEDRGEGITYTFEPVRAARQAWWPSCAAAGADVPLVRSPQPCKLGIKLAGVHWWFKSRAHAAELTAGYYNTRDRNGYEPIIKLLQKYDARLNFTCVEMRDCEHPPEGRCSPQGLLEQIIETTEASGGGEGADVRSVVGL